LILLENVGLCYRIPRGGVRSLKEHMIRKLRQGVAFDELDAIKDLNIRIDRGENVGLIGRNGAGKSSLLKVISRVYRPTAGRVVVEGRVAPLLELGVGFNSELTGRENIFLQGALLGFSRSAMKARLERIVDFAELQGFLDSPTRTYSSGMVARLGFSVATDVDPDILLVDEALEVGDERFKHKCQLRMESFRAAGKTVVVVSHALESIREGCRRVLWIDGGRLVADGEVTAVCDAYHEWSKLDPENNDAYEFARGFGLA
jgi:ABC-type polysaccharide/polyol phosphate transport system ATPase subunit